MKVKGKANIELINSCIEDNVLNIDKLLETKDLETIRYGLNNYPLTLREYLKKLYDEGDWKTLYERAINNDDKRLATFLIYKELKTTTKDNYYKHMTYRYYTPYDTDTFDKIITMSSYYGVNEHYFNIKTSAQIKTKDEVIKDILEKFDLEVEKNNLLSGLTKEYFNKLYKKKDYELLIIKLCVRLEVILRCYYYLEGSFEEKLTQYTSKNNNDEDKNSLLHKLRKARNDIAHPTKNMKTLGEDELLKCIEYVFDIG